jgi:MFS superfamily sulfate permease-like transporter
MNWPLLRSLDGYRASFLASDLVAGVTLAAIAIPEQMATARLGGFSPEIGFFAFLMGSLAFAVFGSSRFLSCGADSTISPIFAGSLGIFAASGAGDYAGLSAALAVTVGVVLVGGGIFRLGWIADLLSMPVTTGFLAGISAHIFLSQLPAVLGLASPDGTLPERIMILVRHLSETNPLTLVIGFGVLAIIIVSERLDKRIPGALIGLVVATAATALTALESRGVRVIGTVSSDLPTAALPDIPMGQWVRLAPLSLIIAIIVMVQTAATTRSFPSAPDEPPDVDRDFVGVGVGSILAGFFGAFAVNASPPRTAIVSETGGRSQLAGLVAVGIVFALAAFGAALLRHVPHAALAGVLLFVALRIVRVRQIVTVYRQSFGEFLLIVATTAAMVGTMPLSDAAIAIACCQSFS